jgi:hypothetical protein
MTTTEEDRVYAEQVDVFERLRKRVKDLLRHFGRPDYQPGHPRGDFTVHGDYSGHPQVVVFVGNLGMLRPKVISELQQVIRDFPGWQIVVTVAVRGHLDEWPNMGLYIRPHEIIDGLQRQYFPKEFQGIKYEEARPGTAYD